MRLEIGNALKRIDLIIYIFISLNLIINNILFKIDMSNTGFFSRFRRKSQEEKAAAYANGEKRSWSPFKNWKKPKTSLPNGPDMGKYGKYDPREDHDEDDYNYPSYDKPKAKMPT